MGGVGSPVFILDEDDAPSASIPGRSGFICLESDSESEAASQQNSAKNGTMLCSISPDSPCNSSQGGSGCWSPFAGEKMQGELDEGGKGSKIEWHSDESKRPKAVFHEDTLPLGPEALNEDTLPLGPEALNVIHSQVDNEQRREVALKHVTHAIKQKHKSSTAGKEKGRYRNEEAAKMNQLKEERKLKREQEILQRKALKAAAAEKRKLQKELQKWEKGKFAVKAITAEIDTNVVEAGSVGGCLLTRFAEKGLTYRVTTNPIARSILWKMKVPDDLYKLSSNQKDVPYVALVLTAEEFCDLVHREAFMDQISKFRDYYPSYTICCLTNRLMAYIAKREKSHYKNPSKHSCWRRPPIEEVTSQLTTHFTKVHSRHCIDEAEIADHIVGLTVSLATCQFRKKLTPLSVNANGSFIPSDFIDKGTIKKSTWLKALIAIPKVQPRFAIAIWKKYPTMRSLLDVYLDPSKSIYEKEFLLKDLLTEGVLSEEERRVGEVCSKRVYRILMARSGSIFTDDVEEGADFFHFHD